MIANHLKPFSHKLCKVFKRKSAFIKKSKIQAILYLYKQSLNVPASRNFIRIAIGADKRYTQIEYWFIGSDSMIVDTIYWTNLHWWSAILAFFGVFQSKNDWSNHVLIRFVACPHSNRICSITKRISLITNIDQITFIFITFNHSQSNNVFMLTKTVVCKYIASEKKNAFYKIVVGIFLL